jgi:exonuclease VII small subunit
VPALGKQLIAYNPLTRCFHQARVNFAELVQSLDATSLELEESDEVVL